MKQFFNPFIGRLVKTTTTINEISTTNRYDWLSPGLLITVMTITVKDTNTVLIGSTWLTSDQYDAYCQHFDADPNVKPIDPEDFVKAYRAAQKNAPELIFDEIYDSI